jgi:hypothetical protein
MTDQLVTRAEQHEYQQLFIHDLHWSAPDHPPITLTIEDGQIVTATNISSYRGIRVWVCGERPGSNLEAALDRLIAKTSTDRLVIFHDDDQQVWRWPVRRNKDNATTSRLTSHRHRSGSPNPKFAARLAAIQLPLDHALDATTVLAKVRAAFDVETQNETKYASTLMARMYIAMEKAYPRSFNSKIRDHEVSVSLARILFLMFGDDTDMWTVDAFRTYIHQHTAADGTDIGSQLNRLFDHLDTPSPAVPPPALADFPYVNGGIFNKRVQLPDLNKEFRNAVLDACAVDWSTISPAIFGSMFQSVRDAQTRRELGEHYTSEENILKTLNPLFLDDLRAEFDRARTMKSEKGVLNRLWARLAEIRFMDPACGCGNFIIVSYRELRDLELQIMERLQEISGDAQLAFDPTLSLKVTLDHFAGIEIDEWPARIAETAMFLIDRQCDLKLKERFGEAPQRLPIHTQSRIVSGVSALQYDWSQVFAPSESVIIAGNPPFLGISLRSGEQTGELEAVWASRYHGTLDYVTGWHAKALAYFGTTAGMWAFVTTNSITQGEAVAPLFEPLLAAGWLIKFAHRTFRWTSEATGQAAVHCVIIGYARTVTRPRLFDYASPDSAPVEVDGVTNITPYLTDGPTIIVHPSTKPLNPQLGEVAYGNKPTDGGWLLIEPEDHARIVADPIAAKYIRPYIGARELLHDGERWCLWLVDATASDRKNSPVLRQRIKGVREFRADSRAPSTQAASVTAHLFRQIAQPDTAYLCIPRHVSETRPYFLAARFGPEVITSDANFLAADEDGFMFAVISSSMFIAWQRTIGGRIKSDLRFNKLLTWNTFPLPPTNNEMRKKIINAGAQVLAARNLHPGIPLADLYAPGAMSVPLIEAHNSLDGAVDGHFDLSETAPTELARQDTLFARYQDLVAPLIRASTRQRRPR